MDRLQQRCMCRSGIQLPGVCAHAVCIIRLVFHVMKLGTVKQLLTINKREKLITEKIVNLHAFSEELKANEQRHKWLCIHCSSPIKEDNEDNTEDHVKCNHCFRYYHLKCVSQESVREYNECTQTIWQCPNCDDKHAWCVRNSSKHL